MPVPANGLDPYSDQRVTYATRNAAANAVASSITLRCQSTRRGTRMRYQPTSRQQPLATMQVVLRRVRASRDIGQPSFSCATQKRTPTAFCGAVGGPAGECGGRRGSVVPGSPQG